MQMTGHKTWSVCERYNIVSEGDLTDAAQKLNAFSIAQNARLGKSVSLSKSTASRKHVSSRSSG